MNPTGVDTPTSTPVFRPPKMVVAMKGKKFICELNLNSKPGLGYILFDAYQCGGGLSFGRGHVVEPVVVEPVVIEVLLTELPGPIG